MLTKAKSNLSEEKIFFPDEAFDHGDRIIREGRPDEKLRLKYFGLNKQDNIADIMKCSTKVASFNLATDTHERLG